MIETTQQEQGPVNPNTPVPVQHTQESLNVTLDQNPTLMSELQEALAQSGEGEATDKVPPKPRASLSGFWSTLKASANAAGRGAVEAVNNASNFALDAAKNLSKATTDEGRFSAKASVSKESKEQAHHEFMEWYEGKATDQNPIQIPQDKIDRWFGPAQGGIPGFVEGAAQFVTGLALTRRVPLPGGVAVKAALKGSVADLAAFDPHQKRLSNLIQEGPSWMRNPLTEFLESKDDDSLGLARFKQAAEGLLLNSTIEGVTHGVKALKAKLKGDVKGVTEAHGAASEAHGKPSEGDVAKVEPTEDGKWAVVSVEKSAEEPLHTFTQGEAENIAASMNWVSKQERYIPGQLDAESVASFRERMKAYTDGADKRSVEDLRDAYGINVNYVQSPDEVVNTIKAMVDAMPEPSTMTRNRPRTFEEIREAATDMFKDVPADEVLAHAQRVFGDTDRLPEQVLAMREWMQAQAKHTQKLSQMVEANPTNALAVQELGKALDTMLDFHAHLTGTSSNVGRALAVHRMPVGEAAQEIADATAEGATKETPEALAAQAENVGGTVSGNTSSTPHRAPVSGPKATAGLTREQIRALARSIFLVEEDPAKILAVLRGPKVTAAAVKDLPPTTLKKFASFAQTVRMEAMLSGPKTQITNFVSNMMVMLQRPAEYWWAGVKSTNPALRDMGTNMYGAMWGSLHDSMQLARMAFKQGDNILLPSNSHTGQTLGPLSQGSWLTNLFHMPSRMLMASDEFAKQMNYRMNVRAQILRNAERMGVTEPKELAQRLVDDMQFAFDPEGGAVNPMALQFANENTFTNALREGSFQQKILAATNAHPSLKVIMPFVRTPINIFNFAWERTPLLNRMNKDMQAAWRGDYGPEAKAIADAKNDFGKATWSTAALLTFSGQITGRGPTDPELRRQWIATKHQPYSIKLPGTEKWMSYRRANPTMDAFGIIADLVQMSGEMDDGDLTDHAAAVVASIAANASSKTFMQGVADFTDAMGSGNAGKVEKFINGVVGSFIPNVANQMNPDHTLRETRGLVDELAARLPGFSTTLEPRRNLLGEPILKAPGYANTAINPFTIAPGVDNNDVAEELVKLGKAFSMPAEKRLGGLLDLTDRTTFGRDRDGQSPYDRMLEVLAKPENGLPSLREKLTTLVSSQAYQNAPGEDAYGPGGLKFKLANEVIQAYQQMAWGQVLKEYPTLREAFRQANDMKAQGQAKGKEGVENVLQKYETMFTTKK